MGIPKTMAEKAAETDGPKHLLHPRDSRPMREAILRAQRLADTAGVPARVPWIRSDGGVCYASASPSIPSHMDAAEREWDEAPCEECNGQGWWAGISSVRHTCERCGGAG